jgi:hypothetical protein
MQFFFASQTLTSTPNPSFAAGGPLAVSMDCSQWILSVERCQPKHRVVIGLATRSGFSHRFRFFRKAENITLRNPPVSLQGRLFVFVFEFQNVAGLAVEGFANRLQGAEANRLRLAGLQNRQVGKREVNPCRQFVERHFSLGHHHIQIYNDRHSSDGEFVFGLDFDAAFENHGNHKENACQIQEFAALCVDRKVYVLLDQPTCIQLREQGRNPDL